MTSFREDLANVNVTLGRLMKDETERASLVELCIRNGRFDLFDTVLKAEHPNEVISYSTESREDWALHLNSIYV